MKAVFLDRGSFPEFIEFHYPNCITEVEEFENTHPQQTLERIQSADIVLTNKALLTKEALQAAPSVKLIQVMATGTNNVDKAYCEEMGIAVQNVDGYSGISVPEHTFTLLLALRRNLLSYIGDVKRGRWAEAEYFCFMDHPIQDLAGSTMVIIGNGFLGQKVASIAQAFSMKVLFAEHKGAAQVREGYTDFNDALAQADVLSLHCPLTESTKDLISYPEFGAMKSSAILLNMGRGGIVNEIALGEALTNNHILGAGFDVASQEPMPLDHPLQKLTELPNFLLTPHVAWASKGAMQSLADIAMNKIQQFISEPA